MKPGGIVPWTVLLGTIAVTLAGCQSSRPAEFPGPRVEVIPPLRGASSPESFTFIVYGDSRPPLSVEALWESNHAIRRAIVQKIAEEIPALVVHTGDLVSRGASRQAWVTFDKEIAPLREAKIPFWPSLGNHDYMGSNDEALENYFNRFSFLFGERWYSFRHKAVLFVALDSNFSQTALWERKAQKRWLRKTLDEAGADDSIRWVIPYFHHPPFTNSLFYKGDRAVRSDFLPLFQSCPKVRSVFTGHVHSYQRFARDGIAHVVTGGGGAPRVPVQADAAKQRYRDEYPGGAIRDFHYCKVTVHPDRLDVEMIRYDPATQTWQVGDRFSLPGTP